LKMSNKVVTLALVTIIFLSMQLSSLPLVSAAYTVEYPYMPPDLDGDANNDGIVNIIDMSIVSHAYGSYPGHPNWDPRADLNNDEKVSILDMSIVSKNYGKIEDSPTAYSTKFEFTVPYDGNKEVWYYVLARIYVPSEENFNFVASANDRVQNVKLDGASKAGSGSSVSIELGSLSCGYHLLEFEFVEMYGSGWLNFHVATAAEEYAWLPRFRVYVPDYSDNEYTVTTTTWCSMKDDYFLIGYADDFIDDVCVDGLVWQDWMWDMGAYGAIYAWGDGFCYPMGNLENNIGLNAYQITFMFGEIWQAGLLDFQYVSWTNQQDKMGKPSFYCKAENPEVLHTPLEINYCDVYGGSEWHSEAGTSWRSISATYEMGVYKPPDNQNPNGHDAVVRFTISLLYLDYESPKGTTTDFAIAFNMTHLCAHLGDPNPPFPLDAGFEAPNSQDYGIHVYAPEQALTLGQLEYSNEGRSFVDNNFQVNLVSDVGYVVFAACVGASMEFGAALLALLAGARTLATMAKYTNGQQLPQSGEAASSPTYKRLWTNGYNYIPDFDPLNPPTYDASRSDILFLQIHSGDGAHCGAMKITVVSRLWFTDWGTYPIGVSYGVKLTTTFIVPYFVKN
jgi:hypothetical protein